jgi:hypothetical protein
MTEDIFSEISSFLKEESLSTRESVFTDDEYERIITNFLESRGDAGAEEEEIVEVVHQCELAAINWTLIHMVIDGELQVNLRGKELTFALSEKGKEFWRQLA